MHILCVVVCALFCLSVEVRGERSDVLGCWPSPVFRDRVSLSTIGLGWLAFKAQGSSLSVTTVLDPKCGQPRLAPYCGFWRSNLDRLTFMSRILQTESLPNTDILRKLCSENFGFWKKKNQSCEFFFCLNPRCGIWSCFSLSTA